MVSLKCEQSKVEKQSVQITLKSVVALLGLHRAPTSPLNWSQSEDLLICHSLVVLWNKSQETSPQHRSYIYQLLVSPRQTLPNVSKLLTHSSRRNFHLLPSLWPCSSLKSNDPSIQTDQFVCSARSHTVRPYQVFNSSSPIKLPHAWLSGKKQTVRCPLFSGASGPYYTCKLASMCSTYISGTNQLHPPLVSWRARTSRLVKYRTRRRCSRAKLSETKFSFLFSFLKFFFC